MAHPSRLTPVQVEEYLYRSYTRVDSLWFVLTEERSGFEAALELDKAVWQVLPKIQARLLKEQLEIGPDLSGLTKALAAKLTLDRYRFELNQTARRVALTVSGCAWHELIVRSGRKAIAERIGGVICAIEFPAFAREFECSCSGPGDQRLCRSGGKCRFEFHAADRQG